MATIGLLACTNQDCLDDLMVPIPTSDTTPPSLEWEVTNVGTGISTTYTNATNNITANLSDTLNIHLIGRDADGGVMEMSFAGGGFTYTCRVDTLLQTVTTSIITDVADFSSLTSVALKEWKMTKNDCWFDWCSGKEYVSGALGNWGQVKNFNGGMVESTLNIEILE